MGFWLTLVAQREVKPYYPGFRDLNLLFVAICLMAFLYIILIATISYRVFSTRSKIGELERVLARAGATEQTAENRMREAEADLEGLRQEYARLTATAPGKWFAAKPPRKS